MSYWKQNQARYWDILCRQASLEIKSVFFLGDGKIPLEEVFTLLSGGWLGYAVFYRIDKDAEYHQRRLPYPCVRRVVWYKDVDEARAHKLAPEDFIPQPTLSIEWREIQNSDFQQLIKRGESIAIPLTGLKEEYVVFGNASNALVKWSGNTNFEIIWAADGPKQWHELTKWVFEVRDYIDDVLGSLSPYDFSPHITPRLMLFPPPE